MLIGLTGAATSGKGLVSSRLVAKHGFRVIRFAEPIKTMLIAGLRLSVDEVDGLDKGKPIERFNGLTARYMMQTLGTEWGRRLIHKDVWVWAWQRAMHDATMNDGENARIVVDDLRFPNEADAIREAGGVIWRVVRPNVTIPKHQSERMASDIRADLEIENTSSIAALCTAADKHVMDLANGRRP